MNERDKPIVGLTGKDEKTDEKSSSTKQRLHLLAHGQLYGVLCTQANDQPYGSMVAFAFSPDLSSFVFSTPIATRKYRLLTECPNVALVVNNQVDCPGDLMRIEAFTATGKASEIPRETEFSEPAQLLLTRHPQLQSFLDTPTTALFEVSIARFYLVDSFQKVRQWAPSENRED
ncbi:MAG: pyridoxamine 5'-phosphate oxidase family protein [candidate division Zixibacteria bacterium]|nr:pyridoxamine 5'-phosphate oxidase family protein [candidate division Zixibacteria bacterium]